MSTANVWSVGRYEAVADHIAPIAAQVVDRVHRCTPVRDAALVDLACGTGSAALTAATRGARVTAVDITSDLIAIGAQKARDAGASITWLTADASDTGLPAHSFDAVVSNMGIIYVEPAAQVAEFERLMKSGGTLAFSSWVRDADNPFFNPIVEVLGPPPVSEFSPDQWGEPESITARLSDGFDDITIEKGICTWQFGSLDAAAHFMAHESPTHVSLFSSVDPARREALSTAFEAALRACSDDVGGVSFDSPYVVVTARRR
ncbi:MAG: hypothetical protein QOD39_2129 [Mycobacterium sp.]|jgi:SAM-dependent methyltransferase|nr:hypothetical protein [Mycobacterium sp.]